MQRTLHWHEKKSLFDHHGICWISVFGKSQDTQRTGAQRGYLPTFGQCEVPTWKKHQSPRPQTLKHYLWHARQKDKNNWLWNGEKVHEKKQEMRYVNNNGNPFLSGALNVHRWRLWWKSWHMVNRNNFIQSNLRSDSVWIDLPQRHYQQDKRRAFELWGWNLGISWLKLEKPNQKNAQKRQVSSIECCWMSQRRLVLLIDTQ